MQPVDSASSPLPGGSPKLEIIAVLRFVAAVLVVCTHATFFYQNRVDKAYSVWHFGEIGVPIFFVISGVVMVWSTANLPAGMSGAKIFTASRLARIVPIYWLATGIKIAAAVAVPAVVLHNHFDLVYALKSWFFVPVFNPAGEIRPIHGVGWTLLHEMFFYALFAAALAARRRPVFSVSAIILSLYVLGLLVKRDDSASYLVFTSFYNLYFVIGMMLGHALVKRRTWVATALLAGFAVMGFAGVRLPVSPLVLLVAAAIGLWSAADLRRLSLFSKLGDSSYALYLFHPFTLPALIVILTKLTGWPALGVISVAVVTSIACAHVLHLVVEKRLSHYAKLLLRPREKRLLAQSAA